MLAITLAAVFGLSDTFRVKQFYLFFLPVMWMAVRFGLEGVTPGLVVAQVGLDDRHELRGRECERDHRLSGADDRAVLDRLDHRRGCERAARKRRRQLRQNQEALERAARLDTMGAFAAALAPTRSTSR